MCTDGREGVEKGSKTAEGRPSTRDERPSPSACCGQPTVLSAGVSLIDVERRFVTTTAATMMATATIAIT